MIVTEFDGGLFSPAFYCSGLGSHSLIISGIEFKYHRVDCDKVDLIGVINETNNKKTLIVPDMGEFKRFVDEVANALTLYDNAQLRLVPHQTIAGSYHISTDLSDKKPQAFISEFRKHFPSVKYAVKEISDHNNERAYLNNSGVGIRVSIPIPDPSDRENFIDMIQHSDPDAQVTTRGNRVYVSIDNLNVPLLTVINIGYEKAHFTIMHSGSQYIRNKINGLFEKIVVESVKEWEMDTHGSTRTVTLTTTVGD